MKWIYCSGFAVLFFVLWGTETFSYPDEGPFIGTEKIPDVLVGIENSEHETNYVFVVEKATQTFLVYAHEKGRFSEIARYECSTGKSFGPKEVSGDGKTPEGVYFFLKKHKKKELAPIYGIMAFPTDYPNALDRMEGKTGNAIWLHGTNKPLVPRDSNGCIVLDNPDLIEVEKYITFNRTPLVITEKLAYGRHDRTMENVSVKHALEGWNKGLEQGPYHKYLKYYHPEYLPDMSWWPKWRSMRKNAAAMKQSPALKLKNIAIFRIGERLVVLFDREMSVEGRRHDAGRKKLFLGKNGAEWRIIGEEYQTVKAAKNEPPVFMAYRRLEKRPAKKAEKAGKADLAGIAGMVDDWLKAWSSKDINKYRSYYARDFRSSGMNLKSWIRHKSNLNKKYDYIRVRRDGLDIKRDKRKISVSFVQNYESPNFKAVGIKQLVLKQESGKWKIYRERWEKM